MSIRRPSAATALASLALFVALGGVSAAQDAATSAVRKINGSTIKDRSVTATKLARGTLDRHADQERLARRGRVQRRRARTARDRPAPPVPLARPAPKGDRRARPSSRPTASRAQA